MSERTVPMRPPLRLERSGIAPAVVDALRAAAIVARAEVSVVDLTGPGAVTCVQGLLTNDLEQPGDGAFVYGAMLTSKGMIVTDGWVGRHENTVRFAVPSAGRDAALGIFARMVPPRLARVSDRAAGVLRVAGTRALALAEAAGLPVPTAPGRLVRAGTGADALEVARATEGAPFVLQLVGAPADLARAEARLTAAGALATGADALELARILAGWPGLASEVDEKTIPQEVRLDEIGGVSYTKGCYTGQETVSRLHFRGHTNRQLRGLRFDADPPNAALTVVHLDREVGRVTSVAWLPDGGRGGTGAGAWIGLGVVRREVPPGAVVRTGSVDARVTDLPFPLTRLEPA